MDIIYESQEERYKRMMEIEKRIIELIGDIQAIDAMAILENIKLTIHSKTLRNTDAKNKKGLLEIFFGGK